MYLITKKWRSEKNTKEENYVKFMISFPAVRKGRARVIFHTVLGEFNPHALATYTHCRFVLQNETEYA